jgi:hypothetical protein
MRDEAGTGPSPRTPRSKESRRKTTSYANGSSGSFAATSPRQQAEASPDERDHGRAEEEVNSVLDGDLLSGSSPGLLGVLGIPTPRNPPGDHAGHDEGAEIQRDPPHKTEQYLLIPGHTGLSASLALDRRVEDLATVSTLHGDVSDLLTADGTGLHGREPLASDMHDLISHRRSDLLRFR